MPHVHEGKAGLLGQARDVGGQLLAPAVDDLAERNAGRGVGTGEHDQRHSGLPAPAHHQARQLHQRTHLDVPAHDVVAAAVVGHQRRGEGERRFELLLDDRPELAPADRQVRVGDGASGRVGQALRDPVRPAAQAAVRPFVAHALGEAVPDRHVPHAPTVGRAPGEVSVARTPHPACVILIPSRIDWAADRARAGLEKRVPGTDPGEEGGHGQGDPARCRRALRVLGHHRLAGAQRRPGEADPGVDPGAGAGGGGGAVLHPEPAGQGLRLRRTNTLGFISDHIATSPHAGQTIVGAQDAAADYGSLLLLMNSGSDEELENREIQALRDRRSTGSCTRRSTTGSWCRRPP